MRAACVVAALVIASAGARAGEELSYADLVGRLTGLEHLAVLPQPGEKCAQWSSYDRRSRFDADTGRYLDWGANGDGHGMIRQEDGAWVMAEMQGPGCIWRIWSARPGDGHVRIYLDGAADPVLDHSFRDYFDPENGPFPYRSLVYTAAKGHNCYVPIPYQRSCKVVAEEGWGDYYHIGYSTFPEGTALPTFGRGIRPGELAALAAWSAPHLGRPDAAPQAYYDAVTDRKSVTLDAGETSTVIALDGPRAIVALWASPETGDREDEHDALRELALRITWDDEEKPAVWAPLGDFFGTAPGINPYQSLPMGMRKEVFYSYWYMPFAQRALVELTNDGQSQRNVGFWIMHAPLTRPVEELGRFHAKWHRDAFPPQQPGRAIDWTLLRTRGRGRFCGVMLHVWNPRGGWWGEGDEKFFVDGEAFPSTFGTGSEDYFGYAWGDATLFQRQYHNQTHNERWNRGHVSVNRWHIADNVPFQHSFEAAIEKYFPNERGTLYACTAYWYLAPGGDDPYGPVPVERRTGYFVPSPAFKEPGALEGEAIKVLQLTGGQVRTQDMFPFGEGWSGEAHLWWTGAEPGDKLVLAVTVQEPGRYELTAQLTRAHDYGIVRLYLDGKELSEPIDLYNPAVIPTGAVSLGAHQLDRGEHKLTVEVVGANRKAVKAYMFGLDWLKLQER